MAAKAGGEAGMHQIGEVAERVGLSLRTIRHYDEVGLAPPSGRSAGGFRLYTDDDVERLGLVKHMKPLGFSLEDMRDLLGVRDRLARASSEKERASLVERLLAYAAASEARCEQLRGQLSAAEQMTAMLRHEASRARRHRSSRQ